MMRFRIRLVMALGMLVGAAVLTACSSGASDEQVQTLTEQLQAEQAKSAQLQEQLSAAQAENAPAEEGATTEGQGTFVLLSGNYGPTATPGPPPTAAPTDYVAPTRPPAPDSLYEPIGPYAVYVETLATTHVSDYGYASDVSCTPTGTFRRGMRLVWRFEVIDLATGKYITDKDDTTTVKVLLPNGEELTPRFSQRGGGRVPDAPWMWSANWDIPLDFPLGALDYMVQVTPPDGNTWDWKPPAVISEESDSRVRIID